jgi:hypothetical protein
VTRAPAGTAARTAGPISKVPALPVLSVQRSMSRTFGIEERAAYVIGRGGALGEVGPEVIAAAFVWFEPGLVAHLHRTARTVLTAAEADRQWRQGITDWGERHLHGGPPLDRLADLLSRCVDAADAAAAPLFAGWRARRPPSTPAARVLHHLYALRELRAARHACAVLSSGITPQEAVTIRMPWTARLLGWREPDGGSTPVDDWQQAESATDRAMEPVFAPLAPLERAELADLLDALLGHTGALWTDDPQRPATVPEGIPPRGR